MTEIPVWRRLLGPLALLYGLGVEIRTRLYMEDLLPRRRLHGVVISVGNLTVGGTGKTPIVIWLAGRLSKEGKRVAILTRGYRAAAGVSDEVAVIRKHLGLSFPIGVGANRFATGNELMKQGVNWFVLDDGFQHLRLRRDVDIVLVDASEQIDRWRYLLPTGRLREPYAALRRADLVVITRTREAPNIGRVVAQNSSAPFFYAQTFLEGVHEAVPAALELREAEWRTMKFFAFCGIGNPRAFFDDLRRWGLDAQGQETFRDHHHYSLEDMARLDKAARAASAGALICTEKDAVKLPVLPTNTLPVYSCRISMRVQEPERFWRALQEVVERKRPGAAT